MESRQPSYKTVSGKWKRILNHLISVFDFIVIILPNDGVISLGHLVSEQWPISDRYIYTYVWPKLERYKIKQKNQ